MKTEWLDIKYREFYDMPRAIVVKHDQQLFFFDCPFDAELDDYPPRFSVYVLDLTWEDVDALQSWVGLPAQGRLVGYIESSHVRLDPTKRLSLDPSVFSALTDA